MNFPPTDGQGTMLARIEKLEKENACWRRIGALIVLIASAVLLMGQAKQGAIPWQKQVLRVGTVQANRIEVLPEGVLFPKGFGPVPVIRLIGSPVGAELTLFDGNGKARVSLSGSLGVLQMGELESDNIGYVGLANPGRTVTLSGFGGSGTLVLNDKTGKQTADLGASDSGPVLNLISDHPRLLVGRNDGYSTVIGSTSLLSRATGKTSESSAASVVLFDPKGNVTWSAEQVDLAVNSLDGQSRFLQLSVDNSKRDMDDLKKEFNDFRDGACPVLRAATVRWETQMKLTDACGGH
jgi:hypothetical protein